MPALPELLLGTIPTTTAVLTRERWINFDIDSTGACSLRGNYLSKRIPTRIKNAFVQSRFCSVTVRKELPGLLVLFRSRRSGHVGDVEGFDGDQAEAVDDLSGLLMVEVMATVANSLVDPGDSLLRLAPLFAAVLVLHLVELLLRLRQFLLIGTEEAGICNELPGGERRELL